MFVLFVTCQLWFGVRGGFRFLFIGLGNIFFSSFFSTPDVLFQSCVFTCPQRGVHCFLCPVNCNHSHSFGIVFFVFGRSRLGRFILLCIVDWQMGNSFHYKAENHGYRKIYLSSGLELITSSPPPMRLRTLY